LSSDIEDVDFDSGGDEELAVEHPLSVLEEKYAQQMRQIFPTKIELPMLTLAIQIEQQIELRPDFQRRDRWSDEKRSRLVESIIMNVPIPPVFLGEEEYGKYVVLDGRQRLTSAYLFLQDRLVLRGLHVWTELNGLTFSQLKQKGLAASIERRFLPAILLTRESSPEVKYEVFDRLNTGGVQANPMEIRNAIYPGPFNDQLHTLSALPTFRFLWGIPVSKEEAKLESNPLYRDMSDLELVLRFFVMRSETLEGMRFKDRLSEFMKERNAEYKATPALKDEDARVFARAVENCRAVFGETAFRRPSESGELGQRSAPYADAIMQSLADISLDGVDKATVDAIRDSLRSLPLQNREFNEAISRGTNGAAAIRRRITLAKEAVRSALGQRS